jgi:hypothetical protein
MLKAAAVGLCLLLAAGCATVNPPPEQSTRVEDFYGRKIKDWQERIRREGWTEASVRGLVAECRSLVNYQMELRDHWATPREFIANGFQGDCEDIATFLMGTLKRLEYPHRVRILVVRSLFNAHALLKVELPDGRWAFFETMPQGRLDVTATRLQPLVEFDETHVAYY